MSGAEVAEVAEALTKREAEALIGHSTGAQSWNDWCWSPYSEPPKWKNEGKVLRDRRLIAWPKDPRSSCTVLTPLGLAVRQYLQETPHDD